MLGQAMIGISGTTLNDAERELLREPRVGGVILFRRNFESVDQLAALCAEIRAQREALLIAVDQEGGRVQRFIGEFTALPAPARLAADYDEDPAAARRRVRQGGWLMAAELLAVGVDMSFAPVLDLGAGVSGVIGDRALHRDPAAIADLGRCYVDGMRAAGMAATGKHFPGHGSIPEDSHYELPQDGRPLTEIENDLLPFRELIATGIDAMMMAHVVYGALDHKPASFSPFWIGDMLRERFRFDGAVFSDDLGMRAADAVGDFRARTQQALAAGCDMVLLCNEFDQIDAVLGACDVTPASARRLAAMRGRSALDWQSLRRSADWAAARAQLDELAS